MKNKYRVDGEIAYINLVRKSDGKEFETMVNADKLDSLLENDLSWNLKWGVNNSTYYVKAGKYLGVKNGKSNYDTIYLHRFVTNAPKGTCVDHINFNTLDNRIENLRVLTNSQNLKHRRGKNSNNSTGHRNVSFVDGKYVVQLQIDGKNVVLGAFENITEAANVADNARKLHYGE